MRTGVWHSYVKETSSKKWICLNAKWGALKLRTTHTPISAAKDIRYSSKSNVFGLNKMSQKLKATSNLSMTTMSQFHIRKINQFGNLAKRAMKLLSLNRTNSKHNLSSNIAVLNEGMSAEDDGQHHSRMWIYWCLLVFTRTPRLDTKNLVKLHQQSRNKPSGVTWLSVANMGSLQQVFCCKKLLQKSVISMYMSL